MNTNCQKSYYSNPKSNACNNKIVTYDCTPWNPDIWDKAAVPKGMDPALYNVLNGCWLCNFLVQETENSYLCNRSFFNGVEGPPCNKPNLIVPPKNSKDDYNFHR
jgi:hypothetical protein